jgi:hypothetical protein
VSDAAAQDQGSTGGAPSEEQLRAAYEQQVKQIRVEDLLLENVVTILNLGMRRTGLSPGTEDERDPAQVRMAIESVRALLPLLEQSAPPEGSQDYLRQIREALSQLQMAFVRIGGQAPPSSAPPEGPGGPAGRGGPGGPTPPKEAGAAPEPPKPGEPGPAQRSGRLWVPGQ